MDSAEITRFREFSFEIDDLYYLGKKKEGEKKLLQALKEAEKIDKGYHLFFQGEAAGYFDKDLDKQNSLFAQALKLRPDDYFLLRNKGVNLSKQGREYEAIEYYDQALAIRPYDYRSLRNKGVSLSKKRLSDESIECFNRALDIKPDDYHSLLNKGIVLSDKGLSKESIECFDKALSINPNNYHSLRNKGIELARNDQFDEAIECYDKALSIKPDDYASLRDRGASLSRKGLFDEAIESFDKALSLNSNDYNLLNNKGVSLFYKGEHEKAFKFIVQAKELKPDDKNTISNYQYISKYLGKDLEPRKEKILEQEDTRKIAELRAVVQKVRDTMGGEIAEFRAKMSESKKRADEFLLSESLLDADKSLFLILRKWNSYTPIIPSAQEERYVGGGYFIFHNGKGAVIDPGYNFIENFCRSGGRITDIDNIVITHAHDDHTSDLEALLSLIYQYNDKNNLSPGDEGYKRIRLYANTGAFIKFSGLLNLRGADYIEQVFTIYPGLKLELDNGLYLEPLKAYHDELITKKYSVGLKFTFDDGKRVKKLVITSDTGLFPKSRNKSQKKEALDTDQPEVWQTYPDADDINLLVSHIGSIKDSEFDASIDTAYDKIFYPNHLGVIGIARVITGLKPKLAVISEFGEELSDFQEELVKLITKTVEGVFDGQDTDAPKVLPGDLSFIYDIFSETIHCVLSDKMAPISRIKLELPNPDNDKTFYYYDEQYSSDLGTDVTRMIFAIKAFSCKLSV